LRMLHYDGSPVVRQGLSLKKARFKVRATKSSCQIVGRMRQKAVIRRMG
jgi:hypothetical protein